MTALNFAAGKSAMVSRAGAPSSYLIRSAAMVALGSLLFGFESAVISGTTEWLQSEFLLSDARLGFAVASGLIGCIVGSVLIARPADLFGRRAMLFAVAVLYFCTALGCAFAWNLASFAAFRFVGGVAVGAASVIAPMYIAELSPAAYRGRLVTVTQLNIVTGILLAYFSNYAIGELNLGSDDARWMYGVMAVPSALFFLLLFFAPESPRWLVARNRLAQAREVFGRCGTDKGDVDEEVTAVAQSYEAAKGQIRERLFQQKYLSPIGLAMAIAIFNQVSGINAILYYLPHIFSMAGAEKASALLQSVVVGLLLLIFTVAAIAVIDHLGRRKHLLVGCVGYILSLGSLSYLFLTDTGGWPVLGAVCLFVASHAFGNGAVIWVFIGEIFPNRARAGGQALGSVTHWVMAAAVSWTFPVLAALSPEVTFAFYAGCMVLQLIWVLAFVPETNGVPLEAVQTGGA